MGTGLSSGKRPSQEEDTQSIGPKVQRQSTNQVNVLGIFFSALIECVININSDGANLCFIPENPEA